MKRTFAALSLIIATAAPALAMIDGNELTTERDATLGQVSVGTTGELSTITAAAIQDKQSQALTNVDEIRQYNFSSSNSGMANSNLDASQSIR